MSEQRRAIMSPSPSILDTADDRATVLELRERNLQLRNALAELAVEHKKVAMAHAALLRRVEDPSSAASDDTCTAASPDPLLIQLTSALEDATSAVEQLRKENQMLREELRDAQSLSDGLARYTAEVEVVNDHLSLEIDSLIKTLPHAVVKSRDPPRDTHHFASVDVLKETVIACEHMQHADTPESISARFRSSCEEQFIEERAAMLLRRGVLLRSHMAAHRKPSVQL